jgi:hypothetical protein
VFMPANPSSFCSFHLMSPWAWPTGGLSSVNHLLVFSGLLVNGESKWKASHKWSQNCLGLSSGPWRISYALFMFMSFFPPSFMPPNNAS